MGELACKTKIILDGGNAAGLAESICEATQNLSDEQVAKLTDAAAYPIIKHLITAEKSLTQAQNLLLDVVGYDGPRP
jgi:hypothetical protein